MQLALALGVRQLHDESLLRYGVAKQLPQIYWPFHGVLRL